jgi:WD40 repeat protein
LQEGKVKKTVRGFNHSVGKVAYSPGGLLLAAERTNSKAECGIFNCQGQNLQPVGAHSGSITHLEFMDENHFISTAKDGQMVLWDLPGQKHKAKRKLSDWARTFCISPQRDHIITLDDQLCVYSYPKLNPIPTIFKEGSNGYRKGVSSSCVFSPDGDSVLSGQHNGQVVVYKQIFSGEALQPEVVINHSSPVCALLFHPRQPILISASTDRKILFSNWTDRSALGIVNVPGSIEKLTTAQVSPDGYFLATGDANSTFILWDLRVLDIPQILSRPLAGFTPTDLAEVNSLLSMGSIPPTVHNALQYIQSVVQQRLLFDIQLVEMPNIQAGEFDVIIDSTD